MTNDTGIVIFDRQHYGKPDSDDMGAAYDLDHDGTIEDHEKEANLTPDYYLPAKRILTEKAHEVFILDSGWYSARHREARRLAMLYPNRICVYVAGHVNAGGGDYSLVISDGRSTQGKNLAREIARGMQLECIPGIDRSITRRGTTTAWTNGLNTIKGIYSGPANLSGVCFEPYFLDQPNHHYAATLEGGERIGTALAYGINTYIRNRTLNVY